MTTQCNGSQLTMQGLDGRQIVVRNDAKVNSSDGGLLLMGKLEKRFGIIHRLGKCFIDSRQKYRVKHDLRNLLTQRIFGLIQGYEDLNDHEQIRNDPLLQYVCGSDDRGAGKSTLNRLELGHELDENLGDRYSKIKWDNQAIEDLFCQIFLESFQQYPKRIILDFDSTDIPLHGEQERRFFHGYYDHYCYLPLYVFCGDYLLSAQLRPSDIDGCVGTEEILKRLTAKIRATFPDVQIIFRGDSGFCRESIFRACEGLKVDYIVGMARNPLLQALIASELAEAENRYRASGRAARIFTRFSYRTQTSWTAERDVVAKAEHLSKGSNPRFIVTNLSGDSQELYEDIYCARGDMENRIKEQKLDLFADRTSTGWMSSNQLRLWFSAFAYTFFLLLKRFLPVGNPHQKCQPSTLRLKLLKVSATVRLSARKVWVSLPESFPYWDIWRQVASAI